MVQELKRQPHSQNISLQHQKILKIVQQKWQKALGKRLLKGYY